MLLNYYTSINREDTKNTFDNKRKYCLGRIVTKVIDKELPNDTRVAELNRIIHSHSGTLYISNMYNIDLNKIESQYHQFKIPKRSGGTRTISAPSEQLATIQKTILTLLKSSQFLPNNAVHSYVPFRNCKTSLLEHQRNHSRFFLKLDIKKYFDNISINKLYNIFQQVYPFCFLATDNKDTLRRLLSYCFINNGNSIPQGACTSPWISNLYLTVFDFQLKNALGKDFIYTRYADDILISSRKSFRFTSVVSLINTLLKEYELQLNPDKIRYGSCNGANWNLGLMYNKDHNLTVGHKAKHIFKCMVHNMKKLDNNSEEYIRLHQRIYGLFAYYHNIEPEYFDNLKTKYQL